ncbi:hydroxyacid dehydrogenase [Kribbella sp.]|uniref:hydroxyacid dehydrogenase n=1 Tax=Kribbella sp. TaxID=1871183 RepID=UPI002D3D5C79|nr:hydroxyacid dehydrogenase [Kribbella sp.]HZX01586.1 hydroxyacid dehydrogenase [Kribbella sp.]
MPARRTALIAMNPSVRALAFPPDLLDRLRMSVDVRDEVVTDFGDPGVRKALAATDILITGWGCPRIDAAVLADAPRLAAVLHAAGSVKGHVGPEVWERGIAVSSAAGANAVPVAEFTVAAIRLAGKRAFRLAARYRDSGHEDHTIDPAMGNAGRTVGIVGASRIGRLVLELLAGSAYELMVCDPFLQPDDAIALGAELVDLETLLRRSDIVSLHAPALPETRQLLDVRRLALLRDGAVVINTARGSLIDTAALVAECASGRLDAVLDVTDPEPLPVGHPLLSLPNVQVTPHVAGAMGTEIRLLGEYVVAEVERLVGNQPLAGRITVDELRRIA